MCIEPPAAFVVRATEPGEQKFAGNLEPVQPTPSTTRQEQTVIVLCIRPDKRADPTAFHAEGFIGLVEDRA
jgi:hypothetical protein